MPETETENPTVEPQDVGSETVEQLPSELMDMIIADESPSDIADRIKDMLYAKSAERVDSYRPNVASDTFNPIPLDYSIYDPYPNPFNAQTTIQITLPIKDVMIVKVYDVNGSELKTLVHSIFDSGTHTIKWDAGNLPSGIYFIRMQTRHFAGTKKVSLIK